MGGTAVDLSSWTRDDWELALAIAGTSGSVIAVARTFRADRRVERRFARTRLQSALADVEFAAELLFRASSEPVLVGAIGTWRTKAAEVRSLIPQPRKPPDEAKQLRADLAAVTSMTGESVVAIGQGISVVDATSQLKVAANDAAGLGPELRTHLETRGKR